MSSEIPVYPCQPTIDIGTVSPGPSPSGISTKYDFLLETISQQDLEQQTPTIESIFTEIERQYTEGIIPTGYQYYFYYYQFEMSENLDTGIIINDLYDPVHGTYEQGRLILTPQNLPSGTTIGVRLYFIFHPTNYTTESNQTQWYIGIARDNTQCDLIMNVTKANVSFYYSSPHSLTGKYCNIGLCPITGIFNETMYPEDGIKLFGSQRLPIDIS